MQESLFSAWPLRSAPAILLIAALPAGLVAQDAGSLTLTVISGNGAVNNVRHFVPTPTVLEVRNELDQPVSAANVSFAFPASGPSGGFADGSRTWSATTDAKGRVVLPRFVPNLLAGSYQILVNATAESRSGSVLIRETNALETTPVTSRRVGSAAKIMIVIGVGAAIAAVSLLAIKGGSTGTGSAVPSTSISLGAISVGAPH